MIDPSWNPRDWSATGFALLSPYVIAAIAIAYDQFARKRERRRRDASLIKALLHEAAAQRCEAEANRRAIETDLENPGSKVVALHPLQTGLWDGARRDPPKKLLDGGGGLAALRRVERLALELNELALSRERVWALTFLQSRGSALDRDIKVYDGLILNSGKELAGALDQLETYLNA